MGKKLLIISLLIASLLIIIKHHLHWFEKRIELLIMQELEQDQHATIKVDNCSCNLATRTITFERGSILPKNHASRWGFTHAQVQFSLFDFFLKKELPLHIILNQVTANTLIHEQGVALIDHLQHLIKERRGRSTYSIASLTITNPCLTATYKNQTFTAAAAGSLFFEHMNDATWQSSITLTQGSIMINTMPLFTEAAATASLHTNHDDEWHGSGTSEGILHLEEDQQPCTINFTCTPASTTLSLSNKPKTVQLTTRITEKQISSTGNIPASVLKTLIAVIQKSSLAPAQEGGKDFTNLIQNIFFNLVMNREEKNITGYGHINLKNADALKKIICSSLLCTFDQVSGKLAINDDQKTMLAGSFITDLSTALSTFHLTNLEMITPEMLGISLPSTIACSILPQTMTSAWYLRGDGIIQATYAAKVLCTNASEPFSCRGSLRLDGHKLTLANKTLDHELSASFIFAPDLVCTSLSYKHGDKILIELATPHNDHLLTGIVHYQAIQDLLPHHFAHVALGAQSTFSVSLNQHDPTCYRTIIKLNNGSLYLPDLHNSITNLTTHVDLLPKAGMLFLHDTVLTLGKGTLTIPLGTVHYTNNEISFLHLPCSFNNLFINWQKEVYAFAYGHILLSKKINHPTSIIGNIILKKTLVKDMFIGSEDHENNRPYTSPFGAFLKNCSWNVSLKNEDPIKITTNTLETHAQLNLHLARSSQLEHEAPIKISGDICLQGGFLKFLKHKLFIEYGKIHCTPLEDPLIELTAKNRINKYVINLQATGSFKKPTIMLEASPSLTEEQSIALLLTGHEDALLNVGLPAMLMQNLHTFLFEKNSKISKNKAFIERLIKPLKYVQITPDFINQSGRGGIKGIISIDINKQLLAQVQKNFNLQDDFALQLTYLLSDEISIHVIKDQRGDLGSQAELRFKF